MLTYYFRPQSAGQNSDVYIRPLINDLRILCETEAQI